MWVQEIRKSKRVRACFLDRAFDTTSNGPSANNFTGLGAFLKGAFKFKHVKNFLLLQI